MRAGEYLELLGVALGNAAWVASRTAVEAARFGTRGWWWRLRLALAAEWAGQTPLQVIAREGGEMSEADLVYGETLPGTAFDMLQALDVTDQDCVIDLGCGRGVVPLVAALAFGARAVGVDVLPGYTAHATRTAERLGLTTVTFRTADLRTSALPKGSVYFLAGTTLEDPSWRAITDRLAKAPEGTRAASLSQPLPKEHWQLLRQARMPFSWGPSTVYLHRRLRARAARRG